MSLPVIFRKYPDNSVVALFPTLPAGAGSLDTACSGFSKHGRSYTDVGIVHSTKQAEANEYIPLLLEMVKAGYTDLKIVKRVTSELNVERLVAIKSQSKAVSKAA